MPIHPRRRRLIPPITAQARKAILRQPCQAGAVLQPIRAATLARQDQAVQRGSAAGLQIGLVPHARKIMPRCSGRKA